MKLSTLLIACVSLLPPLALATPVQLNQSLPAATVIDQGELVLQGKEISYTPWNTNMLPGKVRVVQAIAGRTAAKEMNAPFIEAIKAAKLPHDRYQTTTIVNADDAIIGTSAFVRSSLKDSKQEFPWSQFIYDANGVVQQAWELAPKSSAIMVLNPQGKVLFVKQGAMSKAEIDQAMALIKKELQQ